MSRYLYRVLNETFFDTYIGNYHSLSIYCYLCTPHSNKVIVSVSDVSTNSAFAQNLATRYTNGQLHPRHLKEAILNVI